MLYTAMLAIALRAAPQPPVPNKTAIQGCFNTMDGAVYHGDPSDRSLMKRNIATCLTSLNVIHAMRLGAVAEGPQKLLITARLLDRTATLSFMGLGDYLTALREVKTANLYFRIAAGLTGQTAEYHDAALAYLELTRLQLATLGREGLSAKRPHTGAHGITAYHKL